MIPPTTRGVKTAHRRGDFDLAFSGEQGRLVWLEQIQDGVMIAG
jgi:hypothetical protein